jgi:hypothetical protein
MSDVLQWIGFAFGIGTPRIGLKGFCGGLSLPPSAPGIARTARATAGASTDRFSRRSERSCPPRCQWREVQAPSLSFAAETLRQ